jgi:cell division septation protein DedD
MRNTCRIGLTLCLLITAGCVKKVEAPDEVTPESTGWQDERGYDPLELPQDRRIVPEEQPQTGDIIGRKELVTVDSLSGGSGESGSSDGDATADTSLTQIYRVQLATSQLFSEARAQVRVAEEIFDQPVYLDYEVPNFKVRVGGFAERDAAEEYLQRARGAGYTSAWVVLVNVNVQEAAPLYDDLPVIGTGDSTAVARDSVTGPAEE